MHLSTDLSPVNRKHIEAVIQAGLAAVDPRTAIQHAVKRQGNYLEAGGRTYDLEAYQRVLVVGFGKAAVPMSVAMEQVLGELLTDGLVISKHIESTLETGLSGKIRVIKASHPVPDQESIRATRALMDLTRGCTKDDLVFCLISGGGSALFTSPAEGIRLDDLQILTRLLLKSGADIGEINILRKHLDQVKGGGLARWLYPAQVVTIIISDVIGSPLEVIASGPTVADPSTFADAIQILSKYNLASEIPSNIWTFLQKGLADRSIESVKPNDPALDRVQNLLIASNYQAALAAAREAGRRGFHALILTTYLHGEASQAAILLAGILKQMALTGDPLPRPACVIAGGETTVTVSGHGLGGRNLETALASVYDLAGLNEVALLSMGTDGEDGPTDAAGAIVTGETLNKAALLHVDPRVFLANNDSYHFFEQVGGLIKTGPTGTNVNDLVFLFAF
jgi:glycerate 2-kinase